MYVLVTGGSGYIGSHTCVQLIEAGYKPVILDNLCNSKSSVLARIHSLTGYTPELYAGDIRDRTLLDSILRLILFMPSFICRSESGWRIRQPATRVLQQQRVWHLGVIRSDARRTG